MKYRPGLKTAIVAAALLLAYTRTTYNATWYGFIVKGVGVAEFRKSRSETEFFVYANCRKPDIVACVVVDTEGFHAGVNPSCRGLCTVYRIYKWRR
jgi:hypothetical protein